MPESNYMREARKRRREANLTEYERKKEKLPSLWPNFLWGGALVFGVLLNLFFFVFGSHLLMSLVAVILGVILIVGCVKNHKGVLRRREDTRNRNLLTWAQCKDPDSDQQFLSQLNDSKQMQLNESERMLKLLRARREERYGRKRWMELTDDELELKLKHENSELAKYGRGYRDGYIEQRKRRIENTPEYRDTYNFYKNYYDKKYT